jgi:hypothetical protein
MNNNNTSHIRIKYWLIIGCILAVLLFASPCSALIIVNSGQTLNIGTGRDIEEVDYLIVIGTVNLYPGAYVSQKIYALSGCVINNYGGQMGENGLISAFSGILDPQITVYGSNFAVNNIPCGPLATAFSLETNVYEVLTGVYEDREPINLRFYGNVPVYLVDILDPEVVIDIKPGSVPNSINLKSKGVVPVAVMSTDVFDATTIDPTTVVFAGASPVHWTFEDVDDNGLKDMLFHFRTQELVLTPDSTEAMLTGGTYDGVSIFGTDEVRIVPSK